MPTVNDVNKTLETKLHMIALLAHEVRCQGERLATRANIPPLRVTGYPLCVAILDGMRDVLPKATLQSLRDQVQEEAAYADEMDPLIG